MYLWGQAWPSSEATARKSCVCTNYLCFPYYNNIHLFHGIKPESQDWVCYGREVIRNSGMSRVTSLCKALTKHPCIMYAIMQWESFQAKMFDIFLSTDFAHQIFPLFGSILHAPQQRGKFQTITDCIFCYFSHVALIEHTAFGRCESCNDKKAVLHLSSFFSFLFSSRRKNFSTSKIQSLEQIFCLMVLSGVERTFSTAIFTKHLLCTLNYRLSAYLVAKMGNKYNAIKMLFAVVLFH